MAKSAPAPEPALYCRKCSYDLRGQIEHRCPECGRVYDPADKTTFRQRPQRRWVRRVVAATVALLVIATAPFAWLYYDWRREQPAVKRLKELKARIVFKQIDVPVLPHLLPRRFDWMLQRVDRIDRRPLGFTDADFIVICQCRRLRYLDTYVSSVSDRGIEAACGLSDLRSVWLEGKGITDASAAKLAECHQLRQLYLEHTSLTDAGLAHLCRLPELNHLAIDGTGLTDAGLASLANLPKLDDFWIYAPPISDSGLASLGRLPRLRCLIVFGERYTPAGVERLHQSLPNCRIDWPVVPRKPVSRRAASSPGTIPSR